MKWKTLIAKCAVLVVVQGFLSSAAMALDCPNASTIHSKIFMGEQILYTQTIDLNYGMLMWGGAAKNIDIKVQTCCSRKKLVKYEGATAICAYYDDNDPSSIIPVFLMATKL